MTDEQFKAWLKDQAAIRCILVEVDVKMNGGGLTTRYLSNRGYVTGPSDSPANTSYAARIVGGIKFSRKLSIEGEVSLSFGDIELNNVDGTLDSWIDDYWVNRSIKIFVGDVTWPRADFRQVFGGVTTGIDSRKRDRINIKLSDKLQSLNTPVTEEKLGGAGSLLADTLAPLVFGECHNIEPILVDPAFNEYQVHAGQIENIIEVRDNGVPVGFSLLPTLGKFRLNATPAGQVTCSVQGWAAKQNLFQQSEAFDNAYWTKTRATVTANATIAPDGTSTAEKLVEDTSAANSHFFARLMNFTQDKTYTISVYAKAAERVCCRILLPNTAFPAGSGAYFNLSTGVVVSSSGAIPVITSEGNGWYRVSVTATATGTAAGTQAFYLANNAGTSVNYTGDGTSGAYFWGAQFEEDGILGKYAKTTTAAANIYPNTIAEIVKVLVTKYGSATGKFGMADLDWQKLRDFEASHPQPVGIFLKDKANVLEVCNRLADSVGARLVVSNSGLLSIVQLAIPQPAPGTAIGAADIVDRTLEISSLVPVVAGVKLGYCKNWTVQTALAAGLVLNTVALFNEEWLTVTRTSTSAADNYNLHTEPDMEESLLLTSLDATAEADRRLAMFSVQRKILKYKGYYHLLFEELGAAQTLTHPRFGLQSGKTGQVISVTIDLMSPHVDFEVLI